MVHNHMYATKVGGLGLKLFYIARSASQNIDQGRLPTANVSLHQDRIRTLKAGSTIPLERYLLLWLISCARQ